MSHQNKKIECNIQMKNFTDSCSSLSDSVSESESEGNGKFQKQYNINSDSKIAEPRPKFGNHCQTTFIGLRYNSESNSSCSTSELEDSDSSEGDKSLRDWLTGQQQQVRTDSSESQKTKQVKSQSSGSGQGQGQRSQSFRYLQPYQQAQANHNVSEIKTAADRNTENIAPNNNVESGLGTAAATKSDDSEHSDSELQTSSESCSSSDINVEQENPENNQRPQRRPDSEPSAEEPDESEVPQVNQIHPNQNRPPNQQLQARIKKNQRLLDKLWNQSYQSEKRLMDGEFFLNRPQQSVSPTQQQEQNQIHNHRRRKKTKYLTDFEMDYDSIDRKMNQVVAGPGLNQQLANIFDNKEVDLNKLDQFKLAFADEEGPGPKVECKKKKKKSSDSSGGGGVGDDNSTERESMMMILSLCSVLCSCVILVIGLGGGFMFWQQEQQRLEAEASSRKNKEQKKSARSSSARGSGGSSRLGYAKSKSMKSKERGKGGRSEAGFDESGSVLRGEEEELVSNANKQGEISMAYCGLGCILLLICYGGCAICCYCAGCPCITHCIMFVEKKTNISGMVIAGCISLVCIAACTAGYMNHFLDPLLGKIPVIGDKLVNLTKTQAVQTHHWEKIGHGSLMSYDEANDAIKVNGDHDVVVRDEVVDGKHQYSYEKSDGKTQTWVTLPADYKIKEVTTSDKGSFDLKQKDGDGNWQDHKHVGHGEKDKSIEDTTAAASADPDATTVAAAAVEQ